MLEISFELSIVLEVVRGYMNKFLHILFALLLVLYPAQILAEPSISQSHIPLLWLCVIIGGVVCGAIPHLFCRYIGRSISKRTIWIVSVVAALLFLVFVGPLMIVFGSILATGRTM